MAHLFPTFAADADVWRFANWASHLAPDFTEPCELVDRRPTVLAWGTVTATEFQHYVELWFNRGFDVRGTETGSQGDVVEFPAGSGIQYLVLFVGDHAKGFPNEFRYALARLFATPYPMP